MRTKIIVSKLLLIVFSAFATSAYAEYYFVYPPGPPPTVAFSDCDGPKNIVVRHMDYKGMKTRGDYKGESAYKRLRDVQDNLSTYSITVTRMGPACTAWGYVWVPPQCDDCGGYVPGHWEGRTGVYYYPVPSSYTYTETYVSKVTGSREKVYVNEAYVDSDIVPVSEMPADHDFDRATADDLGPDMNIDY